MKLHEIVRHKQELAESFAETNNAFQNAQKHFNAEMNRLIELEALALKGVNIDYVQLAESVMYVHGNPYGRTDGSYTPIAECAISDIASGCKHLKKEFYGNKVYAGYYQRCDCSYGYGPNHGGIKDEIGLTDEARKRELTSDEKDACIYYLKNYAKIKELTVS